MMYMSITNTSISENLKNLGASYLAEQCKKSSTVLHKSPGLDCVDDIVVSRLASGGVNTTAASGLILRVVQRILTAAVATA